MNKALQRYLEAATGLTNLTKAKAEQIAQQLVRQGEFASDNVGEVVEELLERQRKNREMVTTLVRSETKRLVRAMGLATTSEVERLQKQVAALKRELTQTEATAAAAAAGASAAAAGAADAKRTAERSAAKKSTAKKAASKKSAAKKAASKKSTAKKAASKRSTAKKASKRSTAKKSSS